MRRREFLSTLGGAAAWPFAACAQPPPMRQVGVLMGYDESDPDAQTWIAEFTKSLSELGWIQGSNLILNVRWSSRASQLSTLALDVVSLEPDLIVATSTPAVTAVRDHSISIPCIFLNVADPVGQKLVSSLGHPAKNTTGFTAFEFSMGGKWVQLLQELAPQIRTIGILVHRPTSPYFPSFLNAIRSAVETSTLTQEVVEVSTADNFDRAIAGLEPSSGMIVIPSIMMTANRFKLVEAAKQHRIPAVYPWDFFAKAGGLLSYGIDIGDQFRRAAGYVDRVLRGENAGSLPVQQPTKFKLVINTKTARETGLSIPPTLLVSADEVIE